MTDAQALAQKIAEELALSWCKKKGRFGVTDAYLTIAPHIKGLVVEGNGWCMTAVELKKQLDSMKAERDTAIRQRDALLDEVRKVDEAAQ